MQYTYHVLYSEYEEVCVTGVRMVHLLRTHHIFQQRDDSRATFLLVMNYPRRKLPLL